MSMSRRSLLASIAATLASPARGQARGASVIVIGAGLAGLTAARDLQAAGARVTVVEGRDRIGGRIWTSRLWPDLPMDLGASWIHGTDGNPLTDLADAAGAARLETSYDAAMSLDTAGAETDLSDASEAAEDLIAAARKRAERAETDLSLGAAIAQAKPWKSADEGSRRLMRHVLNGSIEAEYGGALDEVSAWHFDDVAEFDGEDALFPGGFDQIVQHLARGLDIRTGAVVESLSQAGAGVKVTLRGGEVLGADQAVVTVPLGVLKAGDITFDPPLAPRRQAAIETIGMGLLNKCWLRFEQIAWPDDVDWIEWVGPQVGHWAQWVSLARTAGQPVLLAFHAGQHAREKETLSDAAMAAEAHESLKAMFGTGFPAPVAVQVTRWSQDPFSKGAYSFNATGSGPKVRKALAGADWAGRLVFAGEACEARHFGTAHGAVLSGRAAARVITG